MKTVTSGYKTQLITNGRQIDAKITYGATVLDKSTDNLISVNPTVYGNILTTVMKGVTIEATVEIPVGTDLNAKTGLFVGSAYEYIDHGDYVVYKADYNADTKSYVMTCYDKMIESMVDYNLTTTYPITVRDYVSAICTELGWTFASVADTFINYDIEIPVDVHTGINYTYRDVLDEIAEITGSTLCINSDNELEIRYLTASGVTIDENYLNQVNVTVKDKYGPVNAVVFSRSAESDVIALTDDASIATNGLTEIKINDNQILSGNNRDEFIANLYAQLNGLEYYIYDIDSPGITYFDLCDTFTLSIAGDTFPVVLFNDSLMVGQGMSENLYVEMPEETITNYKATTETDNQIKQAFITVNKQQQQIDLVVSDVDGIEADVSSIQVNLDGITQTVSEHSNDIDGLKIDMTSVQETSDSLTVTVTDIVTNGVSRVETSTGFIFDQNGLNITKTGEEMQSLIDNTGLYVNRDTTNVLTANNEGVITENLKVVNFAQFGLNSRIQDYTISGNPGTGIFYIGE